MSSEDSAVGIIGLGAMGAAMARRLLQAGMTVTGYDVNEIRVADFVSAGGRAASSPKAVVEDSQCEVLVVMVATAAQASAVLCHTEACAALTLPQGATVLLCITATPGDLRNICDDLVNTVLRPDLLLLDCPVSGGVNRAANGTLSILAAGADPIPSKARRVLDSLSTHLFHVSADAGKAFSLKMVHQILVGVHILAAVETTAIAATAGLDLFDLVRQVKDSDASSWLYIERLPHLLDMDHPPFSSLSIILKDLTLLLSSARQDQIALPMTATAQQIFLSAKYNGCNTEDDCSAIQMYPPAERMVKLDDHGKQLQRSSFGERINYHTILDLLKGIHIAAAVEALRLVDAMALDKSIFCKFVSTAAGYSKMFEKLKLSSLENLQNTDHLVTNMIAAVDAVGSLPCISPLSITSLNSLMSTTSLQDLSRLKVRLIDA